MTEHLKEKNDNILSEKKSPTDTNIVNIINESLATILNAKITKILTHNKYEKMIPFNLWFRHESYKVSNNCENNQNMRIRYYNSAMLTPLVAYDNNNLQQIKSLIPYLSLYQPFYPETFYSMWEFLQMEHIDPDARSFLNISREERFGSMEAVIFYHEKYQQTYQYNIYHSWLAGKEMHDIFNGSYHMMSPKINYLEQAYKISFLKSTDELIKYDFINIDCIHVLDDIFRWDNEEMDLQANLFYILTALKNLKPGGSMFLRMNMISSQSWSIILNICHIFFGEYRFFRPLTLNPFNSEIYLFVNKFTPKSWLMSLHCSFLKNLYRQKIYQKFYINTMIHNENPIQQLYVTEKNLWIEQLQQILDNFDTPIPSNPNLISEWHASNDLKQIKDKKNT